ISDDQKIVDFININGFDDICIVNDGLNSSEMQVAINEVLNNNSISQKRQSCPLIIGNSPEMVKIKKLIPELKRFNEPVLIQGEPGTGKDLIAQVIHSSSDRYNRPFVKIHSPELFNRSMQDDLFKFDPQAVKGGDFKHSGVVALAKSGTLYLDEIGAMTADFQAKLLQFLEQSKSLNPEKSNFDIRVITATSYDLGSSVEKGAFRKDLYYRLNVIKIDIPPLRERIEDIPQLADYFADACCIQLGKSHCTLNAKTKDIFCSYLWPENVRELEHLIIRIVSQGNEEELIEKLDLHGENERLLNNHDVFLSARELERVKKYIEASDSWSLKDVGQKALIHVEKKIIKNALDSTNWNRRKAASILAISYKSLLNKIKAYDLV
ncbi:MAG: sigma-54-dependent Fis family transcriptional regulator, partial [bacterium]